MEYSQDKLIDSLKSRFTELDVDFEKFCEILIKNNTFVSGSFLLQVIQNKYFKNSDIDIFTFGNSNKSFENEIYELLSNSIVDKIKNNKLNIFKEKSETYEKTYYDDVVDIKYLETKNLKNWKKNNEKGEVSDKDTIEVALYNSKNYIKIINKYKNINKVVKMSINVCPDYSFDKINAIVDFDSDDVLHKYQLIYYDYTVYKTPLDIINNFDLDFCKNYFDGKTIYIKNLESITTSSCILTLTKPRIYKNQNKRIVKYLERKYDIKVKYNDDVYDIIFLDYDGTKIIQNVELNKDVENLIIICKNAQFVIDNVLNNLPASLEKLVIYTYNNETIIDNLPVSLQELRLYIWRYTDGIETIGTKLTPESLNKETRQFLSMRNNAITNIKRVPFDCKIYINDEIVSK